MLADFQQALADLTASPDLCVAVRRDASVLRARYELTPIEARRLESMVAHPGMTCSCIVYRANRLAPLALNLPLTCRALGASLRGLVSAYWAEHPEGNAHFFVETDRFCRWLARHLYAGGADVAAARLGARHVLAHEHSLVMAALRESETEAAATTWH